MTTFQTDGDRVVMLTEHGPVNLGRDACAFLLRLWAAEMDDLLRSSSPADRIAARRLRAVWLDLDLAQPVAWIEDNQPIAKLAPLSCTIRALDPRRWPAVPYDGDAA